MTSNTPTPTTNDDGIPVSSDEHSLTVGPDGPVLLQDHYLIEQMANFNRERIPERQLHAKGSGAFGYHDVSAYTKAALFQPGIKTDTLIGFSTVAAESGSPDTWRDPREGGALKCMRLFLRRIKMSKPNDKNRKPEDTAKKQSEQKSETKAEDLDVCTSDHAWAEHARPNDDGPEPCDDGRGIQFGDK